MKVKSESDVAQSNPTLRDPMDCSLPGSCVHGISQARVLEWVAIAFSKGNCGDQEGRRGSEEVVPENLGVPLQGDRDAGELCRGAWSRAAVHGVAEGQTGLSAFTLTCHFHALEKEMTWSH